MVDRHGWEGAFGFSHLITKLPHTEESFAWLAARLGSLLPQPGRENEIRHLSGWFAEAPVEWLGREIDGLVKILKASSAPGGETMHGGPVVFGSPGASFDKAVKRLACHGLSSEALRTRTDQLLDPCAAKDTFPHAETEELEFLAVYPTQLLHELTAAAMQWLECFIRALRKNRWKFRRVRGILAAHSLNHTHYAYQHRNAQTLGHHD